MPSYSLDGAIALPGCIIPLPSIQGFDPLRSVCANWLPITVWRCSCMHYFHMPISTTWGWKIWNSLTAVLFHCNCTGYIPLLKFLTFWARLLFAQGLVAGQNQILLSSPSILNYALLLSPGCNLVFEVVEINLPIWILARKQILVFS